MAHELSSQGLHVERQKPLPVKYKEIRLDCAYRLDLVVENRIVLEIKSVQKIDPIHEAQLLTYLRLGGYNVGLIMNFNVVLFRDGLKRIVN